MSRDDRIPMNPFPGIRPFEPDDSGRFFGRGQDIRELLKSLRLKRLIAVLGNSGTGKSSLVRAGVIPPLAAGFNVSGPGMWRIAIMRPGSLDHIGRLAQAITSETEGGWAFPGSKEDAESTLRRGGLGLIETARGARVRSGSRFLLLVDQFEELFGFVDRPEDFAASDEAHDFVRLLVAATRQTDVPIYVIIAMRSEFLGHCAALPTLNAAVNENLYLLPALTRDQLREVVEGPLDREGVSIDPSVVSRLINDTMRMPDKLPLLGHALNGLWKAWETRTRSGMKTAEPKSAGLEAEQAGKGADVAGSDQPARLPSIQMVDYEETAGVADSLGQHLDRLFRKLESSKQELAQRLFRYLAATLLDGTKVRRPTKLRHFQDSSRAKREQIREVVEVFRGGQDADRSVGRSFLTLTPHDKFDDETVIDLAHEAIFRRWPRYDKWLEEESADARLFEDLREVSRQWEKAGKKGKYLYTGVRLARAELWRNTRAKGSSVLSGQSLEEFNRVRRFLGASSKKAYRAQILRALAAAFVMIAAITVAVTMSILREQTEIVYDQLRMTAQQTDSLNMALQLEVRRTEIVYDQLQMTALQTDSLNMALQFEARRTAEAQERLQVSRDSIGAANLVLEALQDTLRSRRLAAAATVAAQGDPSLALVLALRALDAAETRDATQALHHAVQRSTVRRIVEMEGGDGRVEFARHGLWFAASLGSQIYVYDASVGVELQVLATDSDINAFGFHPDGQRLLTSGYSAGEEDGELVEWNVLTGEPIRRKVLGTMITAFAFSPDGSLLVAGGVDGTVTTLGAEDWLPRQDFAAHEDLILDLAYGPRGSLLVTVGGDGVGLLWQTTSAAAGWDLAAVLEGHDASIRDAAFSPRGDLIATASWDGSVGIWTAAGDSIRFLRGHTDDVNGVAFSPDGRYLVTTADDELGLVWDIDNDWTIARRLVGHSNWVLGVDYSPDGRRIVTGEPGGRAILWAPPLMEELVALPVVDPTGVDRLAYGEVGRELLISAPSGAIRGVNAATGAELRRFAGRPPGENGKIVTDPSGSLVATSGRGWVAIWGGPTPVSLLAPQGTDLTLLVDLAFDSAGAALVTAGSDGLLARWDPSTGEPLVRTPWDSGDRGTFPEGVTMALSPRGESVAADNEGSVLVLETAAWPEVPRGRVVDTRRGGSVLHMLVNDEGSLLITVVNVDATVWDVAEEEEIASLQGHSDLITSIDVDPEWRFVVTSSRDGTIRLWDIGNPRGGIVLASNLPGSTDVHFRPDGAAVAVGFEDGTVRVYAVGLESLRLLARDRLARAMTEEECERYLSEGCSGNDHAESIIEARAFALAGNLDRAAALFSTIPEGELGRDPEEEAGRLFAGVLRAQASFSAIAGDSAMSSALLAQARDLSSDVVGPIRPPREAGSQRVAQLTADAERLVGVRAFDDARRTADEVVAIDDGAGRDLLNWIDQTEAALLLGDADDAARLGNTEYANMLLSRVMELDSVRVSEQRADSIFAWTLVEEGDQSIRRGRRATGEESYADALELASTLDLDPPLDFDPSLRADSVGAAWLLEEVFEVFDLRSDPEPIDFARIALDLATLFQEEGAGAPGMSREAASLVRNGRAVDAILAMHIAKRLDSGGPGAAQLNDLCRFGSLDGYHEEVLGFCDDAVELAQNPNSPDHALLAEAADSRGVARALAGNLLGAAQDFSLYVKDESKSEADRETRRGWIEDLLNGRNPINQETRASLRRPRR